MRLSSTDRTYGLVFIVLHWTSAAMVFSLFILGVWMRGLDYMHPWYNLGPHLHKSFGLAFFAMLVFRALWAALASKPEPVPMPAWERLAASAVQKSLYILLFAITISGYLIAAADGRPIDLFNFASVPPLVTGMEHQEDKAGAVHYYLAFFTVGLAGMHALAALKHHFIDRDRTLLSMLGVQSKRR